MEINNYPKYLIYPDGRVFSKNVNGFLKINDRRGYCGVVLTNGNGRKKYGVHRLVAEHYIPNPNNYPTVDHINRIRNDNRVSNLRWASLSQQQHNKNPEKLSRNNTSGHKNIYYDKSRKKWKYMNSYENIKIMKRFKTKVEALCYKYIIQLRIKAGHY